MWKPCSNNGSEKESMKLIKLIEYQLTKLIRHYQLTKLIRHYQLIKLIEHVELIRISDSIKNVMHVETSLKHGWKRLAAYSTSRSRLPTPKFSHGGTFTSTHTTCSCREEK